MSAARFFLTPELLEAVLLDETFSTTDILRLHSTSHRVYQTILGSPKLQQKLFLGQKVLPDWILPGRFTAAEAEQNKIITRDMSQAFTIDSFPDYVYVMYWTLRHDPLSIAVPPADDTFWSLALYITPATDTGNAQGWSFGWLPEHCLEMFLTDVPIASMVNMTYAMGGGKPNRKTDVFFPAGTKLREILRWQDMWCRGEIDEDDQITNYPPLDGAFCNKNLIDLPDRILWSNVIPRR